MIIKNIQRVIKQLQDLTIREASDDEILMEITRLKNVIEDIFKIVGHKRRPMII